VRRSKLLPYDDDGYEIFRPRGKIEPLRRRARVFSDYNVYNGRLACQDGDNIDSILILNATLAPHNSSSSIVLIKKVTTVL
jgi:hypothetical protein